MIYILSAVIALVTNFYSLNFTDTNGSNVAMSSFAGKRILITNIATNSPDSAQIGELQQLKQQFGDSLVIIAFPSNSFGNEQRSNAEIKQYLQSQYGATFIIAEKSAVTGPNINPVFSWLTHSSENGAWDHGISKDYQKFLIDGEGNLAGIFSTIVRPMSQNFINKITAL